MKNVCELVYTHTLLMLVMALYTHIVNACHGIIHTYC